LEILALERQVSPALGTWNEAYHQMQEWYYNATARSVYHHTSGQWAVGSGGHQAQNIERIRFHAIGTRCNTPQNPTHLIDIANRARYIEIGHQDAVWSP
jgi:hypothetical protein